MPRVAYQGAKCQTPHSRCFQAIWSAFQWDGSPAISGSLIPKCQKELFGICHASTRHQLGRALSGLGKISHWSALFALDWQKTIDCTWWLHVQIEQFEGSKHSFEMRGEESSKLVYDLAAVRKYRCRKPERAQRLAFEYFDDLQHFWYSNCGLESE